MQWAAGRLHAPLQVACLAGEPIVTRIPRGLGIALTLVALVGGLWPATAHAQRLGAGRGGVVFVGGYFYNPFFGPYPWWPRPYYPYVYFPYYDMRALLRLEVKPRNA